MWKERKRREIDQIYAVATFVDSNAKLAGCGVTASASESELQSNKLECNPGEQRESNVRAVGEAVCMYVCICKCVCVIDVLSLGD